MLQAAAVLALAGTALGAEPTLEPVSAENLIAATSATFVSLDAAGKIAHWGESIDLTQVAERGGCNENAPVFDTFGVTDTDGDGVFLDPVCGDTCGLGTPGARWFLGSDISLQAFALDIQMNPGSNRFLEGTAISAALGECPTSPASNLFILYSIYDDADTTGVGFDSDGDTVPDTPFPQDDLDGNGIPDAFLGGVVLTYSPVPTGGTGVFFATGLDDLGIPLPDDGIGGAQITFASDFADLDGDTVPETPIPFDNVAPFFWGPSSSVPDCPYTDPSNCATSGNWWTIGYDICNNSPGVSPDPYTFVPSTEVPFLDLISCPDTIVPAFTQFGTCPSGRLCADQNSDGLVLPDDFTAWIANYNANDLRADVNQNEEITPTDFTLWIAAFNQGANGPICSP